MAAESFIVFVPADHRCHRPRRSRLDSIPHTATAAQFVLVLCSGFATIVPLTLFAYAAQRMPLTVMGPLNYIVPTINFCLGWLVFHESLPPSRVVGFALVWLGLAIATVDAARRSRIKIDACRTHSCVEIGHTVDQTKGPPMKRIVAGALAIIAALGLLSACRSDSKSSVDAPPWRPATTVLPARCHGRRCPRKPRLPPGLTIPNGSIDLSKWQRCRER